MSGQKVEFPTTKAEAEIPNNAIPSNNGGYPQVCWMGLNPSHVRTMRKFSDHFGASSKNIGGIKRENDPQDQSGSLKQVSRLDTAGNPEKSNIQGVDIHLVKIKSKGQIPNAPEGG